MSSRSGTAIRRISSAVCGAALIVGGLVPVAGADPDTPVNYPAGSAVTTASGQAFDTCAAPSLAALRAWRNTSPYGTVNIYFGGPNRACAQPNLTAAWVREATAMGWRLLPTYFGYQPQCMFGNKPFRYTSADATARGTADATDAVARAGALGLRPGSALYADVEHYDRSLSWCRTAVRRYVSAWTRTLHEAGYLAGVYVHQDSGLRDVSAAYDSTIFARPDAVWMARWDGNQSLTGWPTAPDSQWSLVQRLKQYRGDHNETWGGVTINIDSNRVQAPMATVARSYQVTSDTDLIARRSPGIRSRVVSTHAPGSPLAVLCQGYGERIGTTSVWNRLSNGGWVSDFYVSTPSSTGFTAALPRCMYPGQVTSTTPLNARTGPGTQFPTTGVPLQRGALAWVMCQTRGSTVGTTSVWNRLRDGRWISDLYVSNQSDTTFSAPVPRCPAAILPGAAASANPGEVLK